VEGVVGNLYEVCVGDALEQHRAPLVVDIQISERRKREPASVADLIDTQHGTSEAVGVDSACAPVAGEGKHDGSFYLDELSVDRSGMGGVAMRESPQPMQRKGLSIAGGPEQDGEKRDYQVAFHTGRRLHLIKIPFIGQTATTPPE